MNGFQYTVLMVAICILIICLILIAFAMNGTSDDVFPPVIANCPDYWTASTDDNGKETCVNKYKLGEKECWDEAASENLEKQISNCDKQKWAKKCNLTWDGITNSVDLCSSIS